MQRQPAQNDSTSCGAFVFAYAYFLLLHGRRPTPADFTGANHLALRLVMLHACDLAASAAAYSLERPWIRQAPAN